jgi:hypothetical protein
MDWHTYRFQFPQSLDKLSDYRWKKTFRRIWDEQKLNALIEVLVCGTPWALRADTFTTAFPSHMLIQGIALVEPLIVCRAELGRPFNLSHYTREVEDVGGSPTLMSKVIYVHGT